MAAGSRYCRHGDFRPWPKVDGRADLGRRDLAGRPSRRRAGSETLSATMIEERAVPSSRTVVATPAWLLALLWVGFPLLGAGAGLALLAAAEWVAGLPWAPFGGPLRLLAWFPRPQATVAVVAAGALGGLVLAHLSVNDSLAVTVSADEVVLRRGRSRQAIPGTAVRGVFLDGKRLVLLGPGGEELAREASDLEAGELAAAVREHGHAWLDGDPYARDYRRWVEGAPGLPAGADALLRARERALTSGDEEDACLLRSELARLGVVSGRSDAASTGA
jgi:hypothetical protein